MSLPDLLLQIVYGRVAWAIVAAALLLALLPRMAFWLAARATPRWWPGALPALPATLSRRAQALTVLALLALMALPGAASPAWHLILIFQYPSGLLLGCSLVSLGARWCGKPVRYTLRAGLALPLAAVGLVLYLDAFGILARQLYSGGFSAALAPALACAAAAACAVSIVRGRASASAAALLSAVLLFSLLRLPTGNLWDALLDPLLWAWALGSSIDAGARRYGAWRAGRRLARGTVAPDQLPEHEPAFAHANGGQQRID